MLGMLAITALVAESHHVVNELAMPPFIYGLIAFGILAIIGIGTLLFHNMQQSHPVESEVSPYTPYVHPSHSTNE